jgi:Icc-related predicted phosphoesterase
MTNKKLKIICVADTHRQHWKIKNIEGDIFIFAGDAEIDSYHALSDFNDWLSTINTKHKIIIMGNHDGYVEQIGDDAYCLFSNAIYLHNEGIQIEGINFWGSPYSPLFNDWAFMKNAEQLAQIWELIPKKVDILITHGPARQLLDISADSHYCGCPTLNKKIIELKPKYHITGHIHEASGTLKFNETTIINASVLNEKYELVNQPKVIFYEK